MSARGAECRATAGCAWLAAQTRAHDHHPAHGIEHRQLATVGSDELERTCQRVLIEARDIYLAHSVIRTSVRAH